MRKFPEAVMATNGKNRRLTLNGEQVVWLRKWFPVTENCRLAKAMGIGLERLRGFAKEMGLEKSEAGLKAMKRRQVKAMVRTNTINGCYDRKRGKPVSAATIAGRDLRWKDEREGKRENARLRMKRTNPEKYKAWAEKCSKERKESIRKEKMRVVYGIERKTNLKSVVLCPYKRSQIAHRANAIRRGYILAEDCSEGSVGRYTIYFDEETERNEVFERNCILDGFEIKKWA